jgi:hypothetical protein
MRTQWPPAFVRSWPNAVREQAAPPTCCKSAPIALRVFSARVGREIHARSPVGCVVCRRSFAHWASRLLSVAWAAWAAGSSGYAALWKTPSASSVPAAPDTTDHRSARNELRRQCPINSVTATKSAQTIDPFARPAIQRVGAGYRIHTDAEGTDQWVVFRFRRSTTEGSRPSSFVSGGECSLWGTRSGAVVGGVAEHPLSLPVERQDVDVVRVGADQVTQCRLESQEPLLCWRLRLY